MPEGKAKRQVPCLLWPFWAVWRLVVWTVGFCGRFITVILGLVLMLAGTLISLTVIGMIVGVPLFLFGLLLVFRGLF